MNTSHKDMLSKCCREPYFSICADEGTCHAQCSKCSNPCDLVSPTPPVEEEMNKWCRVCKENPNLYCPACDVNLEPASNQSNTMEDWEERFDKLFLEDGVLLNVKYFNGYIDKTSDKIKEFIKEVRLQATQEARKSVIEEIKGRIEEFANRDDDEILKDIGKSAQFPAPCSRKTCHLLQDILTTLEGK